MGNIRPLGLERAWLLVFLLPTLLGLVLGAFGSIFATLGISFMDWDLLTPPQAAGFSNYVDLPDDRRRELLAELHRRHIEDDVPLLDELGFLVRPRPEWHAHTPSPFPASSTEDLTELLGLLCEADKVFFRLRKGRPPRELLASLVDRVESETLRERLSGSRA